MKKKLISDKLTRALLQLKLTEKEIQTYVSLLEKGNASIQDITRDSGVNRVSIYAAIDELKQKGLVSESRIGKKRMYAAENPESLLDILNQKKKELSKDEDVLQNIVLPMLKAINVRQENKPQIKFFEGANGIDRVFSEYLLRGLEMINCGSYETAIKVMTEKEELKYFKEIKKRKIFYRMILEDTPLNRKFAALGKGVAHTKFLPAGTKISADIVINGAITVLISYDRKAATVIEDESIAQAIKMYLDFMWDRL